MGFKGTKKEILGVAPRFGAIFVSRGTGARLPKEKDYESTDSQHCYHRARGPRQNHAGGRHAEAKWHFPRERSGSRAGNGFERTGTRRSEEHTSELQSQFHLVCRLLLEKKKKILHNLRTLLD